MRKTLRASIIVLAFCCPVFAGDMPCPPIAPPSQPAKAEQEPTTGIETETTGGETETRVLDTFAEVVLNLLALS